MSAEALGIPAARVAQNYSSPRPKRTRSGSTPLLPNPRLHNPRYRWRHQPSSRSPVLPSSESSTRTAPAPACGARWCTPRGPSFLPPAARGPHAQGSADPPETGIPVRRSPPQSWIPLQPWSASPRSGCQTPSGRQCRKRGCSGFRLGPPPTRTVPPPQSPPACPETSDNPGPQQPCTHSSPPPPLGRRGPSSAGGQAPAP
mmetsp:Transcript_16770/g.38435  ORF Transcript_16770/g.38435 Transcript_16770/m.38435 type:complete len:201 (+) Transcript_16770:1126-1728(+)